MKNFGSKGKRSLQFKRDIRSNAQFPNSDDPFNQQRNSMHLN